ncbi:MAG TPA: DUF3857 domain-containing protein, partial [Candidatus Polarisedimenticolaceae bacterium]|nr:DUF3857 domain-containing protein [Candidatus Polarisedimenticolaceae bacterium]
MRWRWAAGSVACGLAFAGRATFAQTFALSPAELLRMGEEPAPTATETLAHVLLEERTFVFDERGAATETRRLIYRIDSSEGVEHWSLTGARYEPWYQARPEIRARVITPDGVEHRLDPATLSEEPASDASPDVHDDARIYQAPLPGTTVGAVVEEEIVLRDLQPLFAAGTGRRLRLLRNVPVRRARLVFDAPRSLPLRCEVRGLAPAVETEEGGRVRRTVEAGPFAAIAEEPVNAPSDFVGFPAVEFSTGESWAAVAAEYVRMTEPRIRLEDVTPAARRWIQPGAPPSANIARLVAALHQEVRYTGVEFDEASIVPQFPAETLRRKYGDCKDKAALLVGLLRAAGIPAELALLATGPGADVAPGLPGLGRFDHAIVHVPGPPELWIDATAEWTRPGELPFPDSDRWALVVRDGTAGLVRTPAAKPEDNLQIETREFFLAEYGPARIVETTETHGSAESGYRASFVGGESEATRTNLENYVKQVYLAEGLATHEHDAVRDFSRPFHLRLEVARGKRGFSDLGSAAAAIRPEGITDRLPDFLEPPEQGVVAEPRSADVVFDPFVTEWRYAIHPPAGFRLHALPESKTTELGPATLTSQYALDPDGSVRATLRFDTRKSRYSPDEVRALHAALVAQREADPILIGFDQTAYALLTSGKPAEALRAYEELAALHPREALHAVQIARALLAVGLGEKARAVARQATQLEPGSALAWSTLGWVLQHDLVGRRFKKGFERDAAIDAYRKAKELDPQDATTRADLAILLEEGADGERYSATARLDEAIEEYRALEAAGTAPSDVADNLLYALLYAGRFSELRQAIGARPPASNRQALQLAAT